MPLLSQICQAAPALQYPESAPYSPIFSPQNWIATTATLSPFFLLEIVLTIELLHFDSAHNSPKIGQSAGHTSYRQLLMRHAVRKERACQLLNYGTGMRPCAGAGPGRCALST